MSRTRFITGIVSIVVILSACLYFLERGLPRDSRKPDPQLRTDKQGPPQAAAASPKVDQDQQQPEIKPALEGNLTLEERKRLTAAMSAVRAAGQRMEAGNASIAVDKDFPDRHMLVILLKRPLVEQVAKLSATISQEVDRFVDNPSLQALASKKLDQLYNDFTYYPANYRALHIRSIHDTGVVQFIECPCANLQEATPAEDGTVKSTHASYIKVLGSPDPKKRPWEERYGYLVTLDSGKKQ